MRDDIETMDECNVDSVSYRYTADGCDLDIGKPDEKIQRATLAEYTETLRRSFNTASSQPLR